MSEPADIDKLEEIAKLAIDRPDFSYGMADRKFRSLADPPTILALIAELRQEQERADDAFGAGLAQVSVRADRAEADLALAREVIEKVRESARSYIDQPGKGDYYIGQEAAGESFLEILATYNQKEST